MKASLQFTNICSGQSHLLKVFSSPENYCGPSVLSCVRQLEEILKKNKETEEFLGPFYA